MSVYGIFHPKAGDTPNVKATRLNKKTFAFIEVSVINAVGTGDEVEGMDMGIRAKDSTGIEAIPGAYSDVAPHVGGIMCAVTKQPAHRDGSDGKRPDTNDTSQRNTYE